MAIFSFTNYKNFYISYNRIEIDALTRIDNVGQGFSLTRNWTN